MRIITRAYLALHRECNRVLRFSGTPRDHLSIGLCAPIAAIYGLQTLPPSTRPTKRRFYALADPNRLKTPRRTIDTTDF